MVSYNKFKDSILCALPTNWKTHKKTQDQNKGTISKKGRASKDFPNINKEELIFSKISFCVLPTNSKTHKKTQSQNEDTISQ